MGLSSITSCYVLSPPPFLLFGGPQKLRTLFHHRLQRHLHVVLLLVFDNVIKDGAFSLGHLDSSSCARHVAQYLEVCGVMWCTQGSYCPQD